VIYCAVMPVTAESVMLWLRQQHSKPEADHAQQATYPVLPVAITAPEAPGVPCGSARLCVQPMGSSFSLRLSLAKRQSLESPTLADFPERSRVRPGAKAPQTASQCTPVHAQALETKVQRYCSVGALQPRKRDSTVLIECLEGIPLRIGHRGVSQKQYVRCVN
jgi:hypothetical protein